MRIVAAIDGSRPSRKAVEFAARLAASSKKARLVILTVSTVRRDLALTLPRNLWAFVPYRELRATELRTLRKVLTEAADAGARGP